MSTASSLEFGPHLILGYPRLKPTHNPRLRSEVRQMDKAPDDILLLVFSIYVHEYNLSATSLLTVCRRWHSLLLSNPTSWSRVKILIKSLESIPTIIDGASGRYGLLSYLSRSEKDGAKILLDIEINQLDPEDLETVHKKACPHRSHRNRGWCVSWKCQLPTYRRRQFKELLKLLVERGNRHLRRWATFTFSPTWELDPGEVFNLPPLVLSETKILFPNLHSIKLYHVDVDFRNIGLPNLRKFVQEGYNSIETLESVGSVEMLEIPAWKPFSRHLSTWPRLHTLRLAPLSLFYLLKPSVTSLNLEKLVLDLEGLRGNDFTSAQSCLRRIQLLDANHCLKTIILLNACMRSLLTIVKYNPSLVAPNWILGSKCRISPPHDDQMAPRYGHSGHDVVCKPKAEQLNWARRAFSKMCMRKMKVESLDPCTTEIFRELYSTTDPEFRARVIESVLSEVEFNCIKALGVLSSPEIEMP
ncbi:hypothetical protein CPB86DRAFT_800695 [Serendipita vermifera]|nr:hypothetical protein CPB86DRAFT_800695 [Serendipita vermifera]